MTVAKNTRAARPSKNVAEPQLQFNMQDVAEIDLSADDALLSSLLGSDGFEDAMNDLAAKDEAEVDDLSLDELEGLDELSIEAAVAEIDSVEPEEEEQSIEDAIADIEAAGAEPDDEDIAAALAEIEKVDAGEAFASEDEPVESEIEAAEKPKKEKKAKEPKEPKAPRLTYHANKVSEVLSAKLGEKASETLLLEVADAGLEPAELEEKQKELLALLNKRPNTGEGGSTQKKVAEKVVMLFSWIKNGGTLNEVMRRTFTVLARDGEIVSGDKGNLHAELLAKPYSLGTCRAQAGQMMAMLPMLKIATKDGRGRLVANPDSLILMKVRAELGL